MKKKIAVVLSGVMVLSMSLTALAQVKYVVKPGDYLVKIGAEYGVTWRQIAEANALANPNLIYPGDELVIPGVEAEKEAVEAETPAEVVAPVSEPVPEPAPDTETAVLSSEASLKALDFAISSAADAKFNEGDFSADTLNYTLNVQSDIYGMEITAEAVDESAVIKITAEETAAGVKAPLPIIEYTGNEEDVVGGEGYVTITGYLEAEEIVSGKAYVIPFSQAEEDYIVDYSVDIAVNVTAADGTEKEYTIDVVRDNWSDVYGLFDQEVFEDSETGVDLPYNIYVPTNYNPSKKYPVVLALHGAGQRTQDIQMVLKRYQMATIWAADSEKGVRECIVIAPQCVGTENGWSEENAELSDWGKAAYNLFKDTVSKYSIDESRAYLTGLSLGGMGTYTMAVSHPEDFAAIVPVCGRIDTTLSDKMDILATVPMWIMHSKADPTVDYAGTEAVVAAMGERGLTPNTTDAFRLTGYDEDMFLWTNAHFSWIPAYADEGMREWLFEQSK